MNKFVLSCESTVDMPFSYVSGRDIPVAFYTYLVDGEEYTDDMLIDPDALPLDHQHCGQCPIFCHTGSLQQV